MPDLAKQILVGDVEAAAKALDEVATRFNSHQSYITLYNAEGVLQSVFLYIREDPEKARLLVDLLKTWSNQESTQ